MDILSVFFSNMKILVTGAAGFIGFHTSKSLLEKGYEVIGLDNINNYYCVSLKLDRLKELGIIDVQCLNKKTRSSTYPAFQFIKSDIESQEYMIRLFQDEKFDLVVHLAAQAGVRYSIDHPQSYIQSNLIGFYSILEACRQSGMHKLIYASSSSVYGNSKQVPFSEDQNVDHPISLYAATKKSNELMAHSYGHLYGIHSVGLRFFTVYGPWGRPDMAPFLFTKAVLEGVPIKVFNSGDLRRDFTYVDDIVRGIFAVIDRDSFAKPYEIMNIGKGSPENLMDFIRFVEEYTGKVAVKEMMPMQPGDVFETYADISRLKTDYLYEPKTSLSEGLKVFVSWYINYYKTSE